MKANFFNNWGNRQIIFTPETDEENQILLEIADKKPNISAYRGGFQEDTIFMATDSEGTGPNLVLDIESITREVEGE